MRCVMNTEMFENELVDILLNIEETTFLLEELLTASSISPSLSLEERERAH